MEIVSLILISVSAVTVLALVYTGLMYASFKFCYDGIPTSGKFLDYYKYYFPYGKKDAVRLVGGVLLFFGFTGFICSISNLSNVINFVMFFICGFIGLTGFYLLMDEKR